MRVIGIDPGLHGACAMWDGKELLVEDTPIIGKDIAAGQLYRMLWSWSGDVAVVEQVASMPGQGVASTFRFGLNTGIALGVIGALEIPLHRVTPTQWKKAFGLTKEKELSRQKALLLFPSSSARFMLKKHEARAEAALLAYHLRHKLTVG